MTRAYEQKLLRIFGRNLAGVRKSRGMTQQELAEQIGMSVVAIAYIETGKRWARLSTLNKISKSLNVSISELFRGL